MAEACESGDLEAVKYWREKDPEQLELPEFAGNTPLQIASLNGNAEIVEYLIEQGVRIDISNGERDTPLIDAAENGHLDTVKALLKAGVDPLRTNKVGQAALDVVHD
ncbi:ankyrin, partial [Polychaeton citri CBS 116435]